MENAPEVEGAKHSISHYVKRYVSNAIEKHRMGEEILFDVAMVPMMGPAGLAGFSMVVPVFVKGAVLGSWITGTIQVPFSTDTGAGVLTKTANEWDELVRETLEQLREARTKMLAEGNGNGGGLITP